ncbi:hypothetical protein [Enterovirga aerilata]|uniref:Uncharacterized protein n=1 Tax=Enterovirga aerilata TaxID=2730920 RepID=A0A849IEL7_9HYPH|nr:hypothetical protein [Enterovirga sp. DB1703]NNM72313.1 hypothetical protein [Enterovirga sp. DB1703]
MPRRPKELPWICPECGYAPRAHQTRSNSPYMYDVRDAPQRCSRASQAGTLPPCPHLSEIADRLLRFR